MAKLFWLASPFNLQRMLGKQFPRDIAFGLHVGPAATEGAGDDLDIAGLHINVTKRIEEAARKGEESRVFASRDVTEAFNGWRGRVECVTGSERPPLLVTAFRQERDRIEVKGLPKRLTLLELVPADMDWDHMLELMEQLSTTPNRDDVKAESVARTMAEILLPANGYPFSDPRGGIAVSHRIPNGKTAHNYIERWFEAIATQPRLFWDEIWLVLNCHFISCTLLRHKKVQVADRKRYSSICRHNFSRLKELTATEWSCAGAHRDR